MSCRWCCSLAVLASAGPPSIARADGDAGKIKITPHLEVDVANTDTDVKAGLQLNASSGTDQLQVQLLGDVPFAGDKSQHEAQLDAQTDTWKLTLAAQENHFFGDWLLATAFSGSFGRAPFSYYPDGGAKTTVSRNAYSLTAKLRFDHSRLGQQHAIGTAPQVRADFARTWTAADAVAVLPMTPPTPGTVPVEIVSPPTRAATFGLRASFLANEDGTPWGAGLSARYLWVGAKDDTSPFNGYQRLRIEPWGYYYTAGRPTNTRVGVAPYVDFHAAEASTGLDKNAATEFGVLVQLRVGTEMREY